MPKPHIKIAAAASAVLTELHVQNPLAVDDVLARQASILVSGAKNDMFSL
jgi:hypothetical protein